MKPKNPVEVKAKALGRAGRRQKIALNPQGAVMSVVNALMQQDAMKIAVGSFLEGRDLTGEWSLRITAAELVPK